MPVNRFSSPELEAWRAARARANPALSAFSPSKLHEVCVWSHLLKKPLSQTQSVASHAAGLRFGGGVEFTSVADAHPLMISGATEMEGGTTNGA